MTEELAQAIKHKRRLRIYYDLGWRLIEPHTLGFSGNGDVLLRAFQLEGASSTNKPLGWKLFRVDKLESSEDSGSFEQPRPGYKMGDSAMKGGIIAELEVADAL